MVLAINGYGDSQELIASFVRKNKLEHIVLLDGREVANKKYYVTAYPTTFLVNRHGTIVDRRVGFDPGDIPSLIEEIEGLLERRK